MKKLVSILLACLFVLSLWAGCAQKPEDSSSSTQPVSQSESQDVAEKKEPYKFGVSVAILSNPYCAFIESKMREIIEENGDIAVSADPAGDSGRQNNQVEDMVTQGIDALLIQPVDSKGARIAVQAAKKAGVYVINFDSDIEDQEYVDCCLKSNNFNCGYLLAKELIKDFPDGAKYALIHDIKSQSCIDRVAGFDAGLKELAKAEYTRVSEQDGKGTTQDALPVSENVLQANGDDLQAAVCVNDPTAIGFVAAMKAAGRNDVAVYGVDGAPEAKHAIKNGEMKATSAQSPAELARQAIDAAYTLLEGGTVEHDILVDSFIINEDNVDQYDLDSWQ